MGKVAVPTEKTKLTEDLRAGTSCTVEEIKHSEQYEPYYFWRCRPWGRRFNLNPNPCTHEHPTLCINVDKLEHHRDQITRERGLTERSLKRRRSKNKNAARIEVQEVTIQKKLFLERNVRTFKRDLNIYKHYRDGFLEAQRAELLKQKQNRFADTTSAQRRPPSVNKNSAVLNMTSVTLPVKTYQHYNVDRQTSGRNTTQELISVETAESPDDVTNERLRTAEESNESTLSPGMKRCLMLALLCQTQKNFNTEKEAASRVSTLSSEVGFSLNQRTRTSTEQLTSSVLSTLAASCILTAMAFKPRKNLPQTVNLSPGELPSHVSDADVLKNWFSSLEPQKLSYDHIKSLHPSVREHLEKLLADWYRSIHDCDLDAESYCEEDNHEAQCSNDAVNVLDAWNSEIDKALLHSSLASKFSVEHSEETVPRNNAQPLHHSYAANNVNADIRCILASDRSRAFAGSRAAHETKYSYNQDSGDNHNYLSLHAALATSSSYTSMSSINHHTLLQRKHNKNVTAADGVFKVPPPPTLNKVLGSRAPKTSTKTGGKDTLSSGLGLQQPSLMNKKNYTNLHSSEVQRTSFNSIESSFVRETSVSEQEETRNNFTSCVPGTSFINKEPLFDTESENSSSYNRVEAAAMYITKDIRPSSRNAVCRSVNQDFMATKTATDGRRVALRQRLVQRFDVFVSDSEEEPQNQPITEDEEENQPITEEYLSSLNDSDSSGSFDFSIGGVSALVEPLERCRRKRPRLNDDSGVDFNLNDMYRVTSTGNMQTQKRPQKLNHKDSNAKKTKTSVKQNAGDTRRIPSLKKRKLNHEPDPRVTQDLPEPKRENRDRAKRRKQANKEPS